MDRGRPVRFALSLLDSTVRVFRLGLVLAFLIVILASGSSAVAGRLVAVGDVHGSYEGLVTILVETGLISADQRWIGGDATLVQTGDLLDRGRQVRKVLNLLIRIQGEAQAAGGRVIVLLGNHEGMNLLGILRDVNPEIYETFVDGRSTARRSSAFKEYKSYWKRHIKATMASKPSFDAVEEQWFASRPLGWVEYLEALAAEGEYGAWLRTCPAAVLVDGTLFVHGGPGDSTGGLDLVGINSTVAVELASFDRIREWAAEEGLGLRLSSIYDLERAVGMAKELDDADAEIAQASAAVKGWQTWFLVDPEGPLWFRGAALWEENRQEDLLARIEVLGAKRLVVGHTPQKSKRITQRFNGRVFLIDTGMLTEKYNGQASALVFEDDEVTAVYAGGEREVLGRLDAAGGFGKALPTAVQGMAGTLPMSGGDPEESEMRDNEDLRIDYIELASTDLARSKNFYSNVFGWSFTDWGEEYSSFSDGRLDGGLRFEEKVKEGGPLVVIRARDLEAVEAAVRQHGGTVVKSIFGFPGGRRFHFKDPSGNELAVWTKTQDGESQEEH